MMDRIGIAENPKVVDLTKKEVTAETLIEARITCTVEEKVNKSSFDQSDFWLIWLINQRAFSIMLCGSSALVSLALMSVHTSPSHRFKHTNFIFGKWHPFWYFSLI